MRSPQQAHAELAPVHPAALLAHQLRRDALTPLWLCTRKHMLDVVCCVGSHTQARQGQARQQPALGSFGSALGSASWLHHLVAVATSQRRQQDAAVLRPTW